MKKLHLLAGGRLQMRCTPLQAKLHPNGQISLSSASWGAEEVTEHSMTIEEAVEQLAYDFLAETHPGWENNEGAYGEFTFDVKSRVITLDHNERYTATESYEHTI